MFEFDIKNEPSLAGDREWLETNGWGAYSSSTPGGWNTRRYHGLLVVPQKGRPGRVVLVSTLEEHLLIDGVRHGLSQALDPVTKSEHNLLGFRSFPFPTSVFRAGEMEIERSVYLLRKPHGVVVRYRLSGPREGVSLHVKPRFAFRRAHALNRGGFGSFPDPTRDGDWIGVRTPILDETLWVTLLGGRFEPGFETHGEIRYAAERGGGNNSRDTLISLGTFSIDAGHGKDLYFMASTEGVPANTPWSLEDEELTRRASLVPERYRSDPVLPSLIRSGSQFLTRRGDTPSVVAGYHFYEDWSRDTLISLPGLYLVTGRYREARTLLETYSRMLKHGLLANQIPVGSQEAEFTSVDGALWFVLAVHRYLDYTQDYPFAQRALWPALKRSMQVLLQGTHYGIGTNDDGLLFTGEEAIPLTWMDAKLQGVPVVSRVGKSVEVNVLWYNALRIVGSLADLFGERAWARDLRRKAKRTQSRFRKDFWNDARGCLFDGLGRKGPDASIRPNQILALALPYRILSADQEKQVLSVVEAELLTPQGLRSLSARVETVGDGPSPGKPYDSRTVWPWFLGPLATALVRCRGEAGRERAREILLGLEPELSRNCVGFLPESFEIDSADRTSGAIAQAWSIAEWIRAYVEDVLGHEIPVGAAPAPFPAGSAED